MFYHIEGTVSELGQNLIVLDCQGIGFALNTTLNTLSCVRVGERCKLYISESVREDAYDLFGFYTKSEKNFFEMLTSVSGIGPKAATSILSANTPEGLALAISTGNEKALTVAPGIGKKIAQRVILELKDKISKESASVSGIVPVVPAAAQTDGGPVNDAVTALTVLGYGSSEIAQALKKVDVAGLRAEEIIKAVLKQMIK